MDLRKRNFLTLLDYTPEEIRYLLDLSKDLKEKKRKGVPHKYLKGKNVVLLFEKDSVDIDADLIKNTEDGFETAVKMGERIGLSN